MNNSFSAKGISLPWRPIFSAAFCALFFAGMALGHGPIVLAGPNIQALEEADCRFISASAAAKPNSFLLGQTSDLGIHLQADCFGSDKQPLELILLVDNSYYVGDSLNQLGRIAGLLEKLENKGHVSVGVVSFAKRAKLAVPITSDLDDVRNRLGTIRRTNDRNVNLGAGIDRAVQVLDQHRSDLEVDPLRSIIIVSDALWPCEPSSVGHIGSKDHQVMGICLSDQCNQSCMADLVGSGNTYQISTLRQAAKNISKKRAMIENRLDDLYVEVSISKSFKINRDNVDPKPQAFVSDEQETTVAWRLDESQAKDFHVGISQIRPVRAGSQGLGNNFSISIVDRFGRDYSKSVQAPNITVLGPEQATPSPTTPPTAAPPATKVPVEPTSPVESPNLRLPHRVYLPSIVSEDLTDLNGGIGQPRISPHR